MSLLPNVCYWGFCWRGFASWCWSPLEDSTLPLQTSELQHLPLIKKKMLIPLNSLQKRSSLICSRNIKHSFKYDLCGNKLNIWRLIGLIYTSVSCNCCLSAAFLANFGNFGEFFMIKMQSDDLRRRGGYPADPQRSREKLFFFSFHAWTRRSEAAASYLNSFATWQKGESPLKWCGRQLSSVLLSILYGYPWPPGASTTSGFTFLFFFFFATWSK